LAGAVALIAHVVHPVAVLDPVRTRFELLAVLTSVVPSASTQPTAECAVREVESVTFRTLTVKP
jgi:hypothetical protein